MGRPKGSINRKDKVVKVIKMKRQRGRPRGIPKNVLEVPEVETDLKTFKFVGYCKCDFMITKADLVSKTIYKCPACDKRAKVKGLKKDNPVVVMSKKDYLDHVNIEHYQSPGFNDPSHGNLKVIS